MPNRDRMERVLYNLHHQVCTYALQKTSRRGRNIAERIVLVLAVCCFGVLLLVHWSFVYRGSSLKRLEASRHNTAFSNNPQNHSHHHRFSKSIPTRCLQSIQGLQLDADLTHVSLIDDDKGDEVRTAISYAYIQSLDGISSPPNATSSALDTSSAPLSCKLGQTRTSSILFSYSKVKGYLFLPPELCLERQLHVQYVHVSRFDSNCFGEPFLQQLVNWFTGPDTVVINWFLALHDATGYVWNPRTETLLDLEQFYNMEASVMNKSRWKFKATFRKDDDTFMGYIRQLLSKLTVVLKTSFLFFITTTLVSFTLRETQERMIDFTHRLRLTYALTAGGEQRLQQPSQQQHVLRQAGLFPIVTSQVAPLVVRHLAENLLFVPIMIGMIFFLIEFYRGDKFLAFMVVSLVWLCEVFTVISLRSSQGLHFFPRIFFLLFSLFHFYLFLYPFGFSYTALASTVLFMTHSMLFFWHRYELPAVALGRVSLEQPRMGLTSPSPASIPSLESEPHNSASSNNHQHASNTANISTSNVPTVLLPVRRQSLDQDSYHGSVGLSRPGSSIGLFRPESSVGLVHDDDNSSYLYFMDGEVVVHRQLQQQQRQHRNEHLIPPHSPMSVATVSVSDRNHYPPEEMLDHPRVPDRIVTHSISRTFTTEARRGLLSSEDDPPETSALQAIWQVHRDASNSTSGSSASGNTVIGSHDATTTNGHSTPRIDNRARDDDGGCDSPTRLLRQRRVASAPNVPHLSSNN